MKYKIGELAKILGVSTNTVRRYEDMGYIRAVRDENSGYRYYDEDSVFAVINAKLMRKYGFSHEAIGNMSNLSLNGMIGAYEDRMDAIDKEIAYLTYLRHRIKDDIVMMKKAADNGNPYEKKSSDFMYVLYKMGDKLLTEPDRLEQIKEFLYASPEVQRICIIRKEDFLRGNLTLNWGWAVKYDHIEKYNLMTNRYAEHYTGKQSVMSFVKCEENNNVGRLLEKSLEYMKVNNMTICDDIIGVFVTRAMENGSEVQHMIMSIPIENNL
ncbi:MAG: MerR family transcriptional regulator [Lachnospiraceae bacterium]